MRTFLLGAPVAFALAACGGKTSGSQQAPLDFGNDPTGGSTGAAGNDATTGGTSVTGSAGSSSTTTIGDAGSSAVPPGSTPTGPVLVPVPVKPPPATSGSCRALPGDVAKGFIAFDSNGVRNNRDIYITRVDGTEMWMMTSDLSNERDPAFAPEGGRMAYASDATGTMQIYVFDFSAKTATQITRRPEGADQPSWARDGATLVFHSGPSIYRVDANGANEQHIARGDDDFNAYKYPSLSVDGKVVVFDRNNEINAINLDGTGKRYVVQNFTTIEETPSVSPDGQTVAFAVFCNGAEQVGRTPFAGYAANPCGVELVTPDSAGNCRRPTWGPEGYLAFERGDRGVDAGGATSIAISAGPSDPPCDVVARSWEGKNPNWAPSGFAVK